MVTWKQALREGAVSGSIAAILSAGYLAWAGGRRGQPAAPVNAVSHWFFGDSALEDEETNLRHTLVGFCTHHMAAMFWGVLHAKLWGGEQAHKRPLPAATGAIAASGVAYFVDYQLTPGRLRPGYENRLSASEMANVYALVALGLGIGSVLMRRR